MTDIKRIATHRKIGTEMASGQWSIVSLSVTSRSDNGRHIRPWPDSISEENADRVIFFSPSLWKEIEHYSVAKRNQISILFVIISSTRAMICFCNISTSGNSDKYCYLSRGRHRLFVYGDFLHFFFLCGFCVCLWMR